ncbi:transcription factor E2F6 [Parambassis ranga]|uniref:Transcription factor E2F6 n=1 Tax=Parambassis ranga TaxID=210632 RepID=A0A6P7HAE3_9TELE|nr:transcription factor E2F6-like [Parambassis ranga]
MVKCIVSGCPNREVDVNRGIFNRPKKRFFSFPEDPTRVKVWLAALRETEKQDSAEQHLICEDHFLPEDISADGVSSDAIPIMPPCLDGALSMLSHWGPESSEEEEEEEEEEDQWADGGAGGDDEDEGGDDVAANTEPPAAEPPAPASPKQDPVAKRPLEAYVTSNNLGRKASSFQGKSFCRYDVSLALLTTRFLELMLRTPDCSLDLRQVTTIMKTRKRRVYDITNVLSGISLIEKQSANRIKWIGSVPIQNFLSAKNQKFQKELDDLKLVEDTLDTLIKSCAQQLFDMTDDLQNSASAYVTHRDVSRLAAFQEQTVIIVKAPEETKLEVPAPTEDSIQIHLKGSNGPITVLTCDMGTEKGQKSSCFLTLEEGPIKTAALHTESPCPETPAEPMATS